MPLTKKYNRIFRPAFMFGRAESLLPDNRMGLLNLKSLIMSVFWTKEKLFPWAWMIMDVSSAEGAEVIVKSCGISIE